MGGLLKADCFCRGPDTFAAKIVGEFGKMGLIYNDGGCIIVGELQKRNYFYNYFCTNSVGVVRYLHVTGLPAGIKWQV